MQYVRVVAASCLSHHPESYVGLHGDAFEPERLSVGGAISIPLQLGTCKRVEAWGELVGKTKIVQNKTSDASE